MLVRSLQRLRPTTPLLIATYAVLLPMLVFFAPLSVGSVLGSVMVVVGALRWGGRGGELAALWSTLVLLAHAIAFRMAGQGSDIVPLVSWSVTYLIIGLGVGIATERTRKHEDHLARTVAELDKAKEHIRENEEKYRLLFDHSLNGFALYELITDATGAPVDAIMVEANHAYEELTGLRRSSIVGKKITETMGIGKGSSFISVGGRVALSGEPTRYDYFSARFNRHYDMAIYSPRRGQFATAFFDITDRKKVEEALHEANEKLVVWVNELEQRSGEMTTLAEMGELLQACVSPEEAHSVISRSTQKLFPSRSGALFVLNSSRNLAEAVVQWGGQAPCERLLAPSECWALRRGRPHTREDAEAGLACPHTGAEPGSCHFCIPLLAQGETLGVLSLFGPALAKEAGPSDYCWSEAERRLVVTVSEHVALAVSNMKLRETLRNQAIRDPLTGLFNRRYLEETLEREIYRSARRGSSVGIMMLDLDHFKRFNDVFGHEAGDALLCRLGEALRLGIRAEDVACRYGGEEFVLVMPEASITVTESRAEKLRAAVKQLSVEYRGQLLGQVTLSIGIASYPEHGSTGQTVMRAADSALYRAKAEGRDRVTVAGAAVTNVA